MQKDEGPRKLILRCFLSPGDIVMMTAAVRDLHRAHPGRFLTDVRTSTPPLWEHNPYLTPLVETDPEVRILDLHYPLINVSNQRPYHFIHGFAQFLERELHVPVPLTEFRGDIHLTPEEKSWLSQVEETGFQGRFWIILAGGKYDFTAKWWNPACYQQVVDHFQGRIQFVQCGEAQHWHPRLDGVLDLVGQTDLRQFIRLVHHADGVLCPVTFAMHLAAAVETKPGRPKHRACVVVAGGREPAHWEMYPHHQFLSLNGALWCCEEGGCWRARCQTLGDGADQEQNLCVLPVAIAPDLHIPRCMDLITPADVIRRISFYYEGGTLEYNS
ncbi:MAG: ADP-heptose--LPS heptosyltransferase [Planctomycetes bacterium]|nr:ADP-heptose--LPS heptosyltransferase [Planctomycetota bacterium]